MDLDIDSLNNNGFNPTNRGGLEGWWEDFIENFPFLPGKWVGSNHTQDKDSDGAPDYADGFDLLPLWPDDDANVNEKFVPLTLELKVPINLANAKIRFTYDESDPAR